MYHPPKNGTGEDHIHTLPECSHVRGKQDGQLVRNTRGKGYPEKLGNWQRIARKKEKNDWEKDSQNSSYALKVCNDSFVAFSAARK